MQDLLAFSFSLQPRNGNSDSGFRDISERTARWAWQRTGQAAPDLLSEPEGRSLGADGVDLRWRGAEVADRADRGLEVELRHPADNDPGLEWRTLVEIVQAERHLRVGVYVGREATRLALRPADVVLGAPRLVRELVAAYAASAGSVELSASPVFVDPPGVKDRLVPLLGLAPPERVLPVVVLAPLNNNADAERLAARLVGLAHVVQLSGYLSYRRLQEELPLAFVPPDGVRLYWPGFGSAGDDLTHPYWTRTRIADLGGSLDDAIFRMLSRISVVRVPRDPLLRELRLAARTSRRNAWSVQTEAAALQELVDLAQDEIDEKEAEIARKTREIDAKALEIAGLRAGAADAAKDDEIKRLIGKVSSLEAALENSRANLAAVMGRPPEAVDAEVLSAPTDWNSFADRIAALERETDGALVITENGRESARGTQYPNAERMWDHLERLALAAMDYRQRGAAVGGRLKEWFVQYELHYAAHDSWLGAWANFTSQGRSYSREPHIKVDDAKHGTAQVGRIYFAVDGDDARFIVDHIGSKPF